jgi:hypothetical protein
LLALAEVPCLIGNRDYRVDLVPVDWVVEDLLDLCDELETATAAVHTTIAAGLHSLPLHELIELIAYRLRVFHIEQDLPVPPEVSVITRRQFDFLIGAAASWNLERRFEHAKRVSEVMAGYLNHSVDTIALTPTRVRNYPDSPQAAISRCVDYWLVRNAARLRSPLDVQASMEHA